MANPSQTIEKATARLEATLTINLVGFNMTPGKLYPSTFKFTPKEGGEEQATYEGMSPMKVRDNGTLVIPPMTLDDISHGKADGRGTYTCWVRDAVPTTSDAGVVSDPPIKDGNGNELVQIVTID